MTSLSHELSQRTFSVEHDSESNLNHCSLSCARLCCASIHGSGSNTLKSHPFSVVPHEVRSRNRRTASPTTALARGTFIQVAGKIASPSSVFLGPGRQGTKLHRWRLAVVDASVERGARNSIRDSGETTSTPGFALIQPEDFVFPVGGPGKPRRRCSALTSLPAFLSESTVSGAGACLVCRGQECVDFASLFPRRVLRFALRESLLLRLSSPLSGPTRNKAYSLLYKTSKQRCSVSGKYAS